MHSYPLMKYLKILVVDDHVMILKAISGLLTSAGVSDITLAPSSEKAIEVFDRKKYDVIISDIEMEKMNGLELLKLIRMGKTMADPSTPFIVLTSHANTTAIGIAIGLDVNGFLVKPTKLDQVFTKIDAAVNTKFRAKHPIVYDAISTDIDTQDKVLNSTANKHTERNTPDSLILEISINDVNPGMILYDDILHKNGKILIARDHCFTYASRDRLLELTDQLASPRIVIKIK